MKKTVILLIATILLIFACDRFEHTFEPEDYDLGLEQFPSSFKETIENLNQFNYQEIRVFFSEDYKNGSWGKDEMVDYLTHFLFYGENVTLHTDSVFVSYSNLSSHWNFTAISEDREILADTTFIDYLIKENEEYKFYGDQEGSQKILVELFTSITCTYCPLVENALHNLRFKYSSRLKYTEYHIGDALDCGNMQLLSYYPGHGVLPLTIIHGNAAIIEGASEEIEEDIDAVITPIMNETPTVELYDLQASLEADQLTGSVILDVETSISTDDLYLKFVILEDFNTEYYNFNGDHLHNVVWAREEISLSDSNFDDSIQFAITDLSDLPDDITLIVWVQTLEDPYNSNTCKVYNVIEKSLSN